MAWAVGAIAAILFVYLMSTVPVFRKTVGVIFLVIAVTGGGVVMYSAWEAQQNSEKSAALRSMISPSQLEFKDMTMQMAYPFELKGRMKNLHPSATMDTARLKIIVTDCPPNGYLDILPCEVIGQGSVDLYEKVPAGQVRAVNTYVHDMKELPRATGKASWSLSVTEVTAADQ